jgi:hypothetical protein
MRGCQPNPECVGALEVGDEARGAQDAERRARIHGRMPWPGRGLVRRTAGAMAGAGPSGSVRVAGTADRAEREKDDEKDCGPLPQGG